MSNSGVTPEFIRAVSEETGVPEWLLTAGGNNTMEGVWSRASDAVEWKYATAPAEPRPPTAAVSASSPPPTRIPLQQSVPGDDWLGAWRAGRLTPMGAPAPPPRRNNGHTRTNKP
jgi:hypothetical protein